jgi:acyl-CoA reductase-like NAD-dependent aldehyde dehydrogenase
MASASEQLNQTLETSRLYMAILNVVESESGTPRRIELQSPVTLEVIGSFDVCGVQQVEQAIVKAREAQKSWAALSYAQRAQYLAKLQALLVSRCDDIMATISSESGKADMETLAEVIGACDALQYYGKHAAKILKSESKRPHLFYPMKKMLKTYHPKGVVGVITPWNFPFATTVVPTAQALMAGNTVIVKPSEVTPLSGELLGTLAAEAGLPDGVLQVVLGDGSTGAALCSGGVDKIHFTGSVKTGRLVGAQCGSKLIACTLELGGKDPAIVCADANLQRAVHGVLNGALFNTGQVCASTERIYVVESIHDQFVDALAKAVKGLRQQGDGDADISCMIWDRQLALVEGQLRDAVEKGATIITGGKRQLDKKGLFLEPTLLSGVDHSMLIMTEETFGPVLPVMKVKDEEEAIRLANDSPYGLSGSVWVGDRKRGVDIAKRLESGGCAVNEFGGSIYGAHEGSFGGRKDSGIGYVNGELGLRSFCNVQHMLVHRFGPSQEMNWFPYDGKSVDGMKKFLKFYFGTIFGRWLS